MCPWDKRKCVPAGQVLFSEMWPLHDTSKKISHYTMDQNHLKNYYNTGLFTRIKCGIFITTKILLCAKHLTAAWCNNHRRHHFNKRCSKQIGKWCAERSDPARFHHFAGRGSSWAEVSLGNQGERSRPLHPSQSHSSSSVIKVRHVDWVWWAEGNEVGCTGLMGVDDVPRSGHRLKGGLWGCRRAGWGMWAWGRGWNRGLGATLRGQMWGHGWLY